MRKAILLGLATLLAACPCLTQAKVVGGSASPSENTGARKTKAPSAPTIDLVIAAGEAGDESLSRGVYLFHLKCAGSCDLERTSLNECTNKGDAKFVPRVAEYSSSMGNMEIKAVSHNTLELVVYQAFEHLLPATLTFTFDPAGPPFEKLTAFKTSGFRDFRDWPKNFDKVVEFVPVETDRVKALDCPVFLPGLNHGRWEQGLEPVQR